MCSLCGISFYRLSKVSCFTQNWYKSFRQAIYQPLRRVVYCEPFSAGDESSFGDSNIATGIWGPGNWWHEPFLTNDTNIFGKWYKSHRLVARTFYSAGDAIRFCWYTWTRSVSDTNAYTSAGHTNVIVRFQRLFSCLKRHSENVR